MRIALKQQPIEDAWHGSVAKRSEDDHLSQLLHPKSSYWERDSRIMTIFSWAFSRLGSKGRYGAVEMWHGFSEGLDNSRAAILTVVENGMHPAPKCPWNCPGSYQSPVMGVDFSYKRVQLQIWNVQSSANFYIKKKKQIHWNKGNLSSPKRC
jgi:hypothetical protein